MLFLYAASLSELLQWRDPGIPSGVPGNSAPSTAPQQVRTVRGHRLEVTLTSLHQFTCYEVTVRAFNQVGSGPASPTQSVTTLEGGR